MAWRVLVVDDDLSVGMALYGANTSIEIVEAKDLSDALELASSTQFDAIVCEQSLPDGDGLQFVRLARAMSTAANIPIIVLTSHYEARARDEVLAAGADGYLPKPIRPDALITGLAAAVTRRKPRHLASAPTTNSSALAPPVDPANGHQADIARLRSERDAANDRTRRALDAAEVAEAQLAEARLERDEMARQLAHVVTERDNLAAQISGLLGALADTRTELTDSRAAAAERESTIAELQLLVADLQREVESQQAIDLRGGPQHAKKQVRDPSM
jgi:two-component system, chemotaxis family, chemotaxis protein CheY